ncbi:hypothetical protein [Streptomyces sp. NPDC002722]|uniref:hypothetical protein n=1 Tax=Streptomyces sp. NPDC002722 TaxID=3154425 RepID=UPI003320030E
MNLPGAISAAVIAVAASGLLVRQYVRAVRRRRRSTGGQPIAGPVTVRVSGANHGVVYIEGDAQAEIDGTTQGPEDTEARARYQGYEDFSAEVMRQVREYPIRQRERFLRELQARDPRTIVDGAFYLPYPRDDEQPTPDETSAVAPTSMQSLDHAMAMLFIRLGPPPETTETNYAPVSNGGGGAQQ